MSLWDEIKQTTSDLASVWGGVEVTREETDQLKYQYQIEALRNQQSAQEYDTQDTALSAVTAPVREAWNQASGLKIVGAVAALAAVAYVMRGR